METNEELGFGKDVMAKRDVTTVSSDMVATSTRREDAYILQQGIDPTLVGFGLLTGSMVKVLDRKVYSFIICFCSF